jgi:transcriptional regulator with XRE-family HTH domain
VSNIENFIPRNEAHNLSKILSKLMEENGIDDAILARNTGVPAATIARLRANPKANPTASTLRPLAKFFNLSVSQLLGDDDPAKVQAKEQQSSYKKGEKILKGAPEDEITLFTEVFDYVAELLGKEKLSKEVFKVTLQINKELVNKLRSRHKKLHLRPEEISYINTRLKELGYLKALTSE